MNPKWIFYLGIAVTVEQAIGHGSVSIANVVPDAWAPYVKGWCELLAFVGTAVMTGMTGYSSNQPGPLNSAPAAPVAKLAALFAVLVLGALLIPTPGRAGDLPIKAPAFAAPSPCLPTSCTGLYVGVNLTGTMTNADVIGGGINGSVAGGGQSIGVQAGYQFANASFFFGPEFDANYVVNGNPNVTGGAPSKYRVGEYLKVGTSLATLLGIQPPAAGSPGIPAALASAVISPYIVAGAVQSGIGQGWATGAGIEYALAQNWFLDTRYTYVNYGSASVSPTETAKSENLVTVGFNYKF